MDKDVLKKVNEAIDVARGLGYEIKEVSLPYIPYALAVYYIIRPAEVSANLARFDGIRYGLHKNGICVLSLKPM